MTNGYHKIDDIFRQKLENVSEIPSANVWLGIKKAIILKKIISFNFIAGSKVLSILTVAAGLGIVAVSAFFLVTKNETKPAISSAQENIIENITPTAETFDNSVKIEMNENNEENNIKPKTGLIQNDFIKTTESKSPFQIQRKEDKPEYSKMRELFWKSKTYRIWQNLFFPQYIFRISTIENYLPYINSNQSINNKKGIFFISYYSSYDFNKSIISSQNILPDSYLSSRQSIESPVIYPGFGLETRLMNKNWFAVTGLNYKISGEKIKNPYSLLRIDSIGILFDTITKIGWNVYWDSLYMRWDSSRYYFTDTTFFPLYDTITVSGVENINNKLHYLEIPLLIGHQFSIGKIDLLLSGGVSFAFLLTSEGKFMDFYTNELIPYNNKLLPLVNKSMMNLIFRAACSYPINNQFSVYLEPTFQYSLNSVLDKGYPIRQKYWIMGLRTGISIKL